MAEGGVFENPAYDPDDPEVAGNDDDDDEYEQNRDETLPFIPGSASTPGPNGGEEITMKTRSHEKSGLPDTSYDEIPLLGSFVNQDDKPGMIERAKDFIKKKFPKVDFGKMDPIGFGKKKGNETKVVKLKFSEKMGGVFSKNSQTSSKQNLGPKLNL